MLTIRIILVLSILVIVESIELKGLQILVNLISGGEFIETKKDDEDHSSNLQQPAASDGFTKYSFIDYITYNDMKMCYVSEPEHIRNAREKYDGPKAPIKVKCLPDKGNGTVHVVNSVKEVVSILAPHGNSTKRNVEGNCAIILFYTRSCPGSAMVAPHYNALSKQFPDIRIAAIDAFKFHSFNTEFGIVGLPTVMLFHQGRPIIKFNDTTATVNNFIKFVTKHTGIKPNSSSVYVTSEDFNGPLSNKVQREADKYLYLAWAFIIMCGSYYFTKSKLYTQIIEMIKRNWRESEAQHEHNS